MAPKASKSRKEITAAGCVVLREGKAGTEVLLVHRPCYDDWSLPKGKLNPDEYLPACAARETVEETAATVRLGIPADQIRYPVGSGLKTVSYWRARLLGQDVRPADKEVDQVAWMSLTQAIRTSSYPDERALIRQAANLPDATALVIVRHAKAMLRGNWSGRDQARPLNERGRRQAKLLVPLLEAYGVDRLTSSTSVRCMKTLQPHAKAHRLEVEGWTTFTEEQAEKNPAAVTKLMRRLATQTATSGIPTAVCGHRPVLPIMLEAIGLQPRALQPGAALIAHLSPSGEVLAAELHKPRV